MKYKLLLTSVLASLACFTTAYAMTEDGGESSREEHAAPHSFQYVQELPVNQQTGPKVTRYYVRRYDELLRDLGDRGHLPWKLERPDSAWLYLTLPNGCRQIVGTQGGLLDTADGVFSSYVGAPKALYPALPQEFNHPSGWLRSVPSSDIFSSYPRGPFSLRDNGPVLDSFFVVDTIASTRFYPLEGYLWHPATVPSNQRLPFAEVPRAEDFYSGGDNLLVLRFGTSARGDDLTVTNFTLNGTRIFTEAENNLAEVIEVKK